MNEVRKLPILLAALTLTSAAFIIAPEAAASNHDDAVSVYDITVRGDHPIVERWTTVTAHLPNNGDADKKVDVEFFWIPKGSTKVALESDSFSNTTGPCAGQLDSEKRSVTVPGNGEAPVTLCWIPSTVQADKNGEGSIQVEVSEGAVTGLGSVVAEKTKPFKIQYPKVSVEAQWVKLDKEDIKKSCDPSADRQVIDCTIRPEQAVAFDVTVANTGNYPDLFDIRVGNCERDEAYDYGEWKVETTADQLYILNTTEDDTERHIRTVTLHITAPKTAKFDTDLHNGLDFCVFAKSLSSDVESGTARTEFPILPVERTYNANVSNHRPRVYGLVNEPIELNASIHNAGNAQDFFKVEYVEPTPGNPWNITRDWTFNLRDVNEKAGGRGISLDADQRGDATFTITPPANATRGWYNLTMKWYSPDGVNSTKDSAESRETLTYRVRINQTYQLRTDPVQPETLARLAPAKTAEYQLTVHNDGNGPDNMTYRVEGVPGGWTWTLDGVDGHQVRLGPGENRTLTFRVTTPPGEKKDKEASMYVNLTSEGPKDAEKKQVSFRTRLLVLERSNVEATTSGDAPFLDPGESHTYTVTLRNVGNVYDNFTLDIDPENTVPEGWRATVEPTLIYLAPPGKPGAPNSATARVTLTAPDTAEVGDLGGTLLTVASTESPDVSRTLDFEARVSGPDLAVTELITRNPLVYEGEPNLVFVRYANTGNLDAKNVTLQLELRPANGNPIPLDTRTLTAVAGRSSATLEVPFDFADLAGEATLVATIDPENAVKEIEESDNQKSVATFIRTWGVALDGTAQGLNAHPGERVAYLDAPNAFVVRNDGNRDEPLTVTLTSEHGWLLGDSSLCRFTNPVIVPAGSKRTFCAELKVPELPGARADRLTFTVTSENRPGITLTTRVNTTIVDEEPPRITDFRATPSPALVGEPVEISATVQDAVGVDSVVASVKRGDATPEILTLEPAGGDKWAVTTVFDRTGEVLIRLTATDSTPNANSNTTRLDFLKLQIEASSTPDVTVTVPESKTLRAGTPIPVEVTDRYEIERVWYVANGVTGRDLADPYAIDTSSWKDGKYHVLVYAENVHGMRSVNEFNLTVDNRIPDAPEVQVSDERVQPGEPITVTIRTESRIDEVKVIVKRDGVPVDNQTARKTRDGVFALEYTPTTAGAYTFDVVVRDGVGNERPVTGAGSFTASSSPIPAAGVPGILAALGVAAARALRRRDP